MPTSCYSSHLYTSIVKNIIFPHSLSLPLPPPLGPLPLLFPLHLPKPQACDLEMDAFVSGTRCTCDPNADLTLLEDNFYMEVEELPMMMQFNLSDLFPFTRYCVQAVGDYESEITLGVGMIARTASEFLKSALSTHVSFLKSALLTSPLPFLMSINTSYRLYLVCRWGPRSPQGVSRGGHPPVGLTRGQRLSNHYL